MNEEIKLNLSIPQQVTFFISGVALMFGFGYTVGKQTKATSVRGMAPGKIKRRPKHQLGI